MSLYLQPVYQVKLLGWIYHDKFGGKSPRKFFMEASRESLDIGIAFFSMTVINQPKKPHTIVHCTVGKVGSKREAENKTAPLSIFCHLFPWDIIMHRQ